jgi:aminopeptidase N
VPRGYERAAEVELAAVSGGLREFGARYGAYPYAQLTVVHPPPIAAEAGGMEYPTLITTGGPAWLAALPVRPFEQVTLHELGHQWFYGLVATNENRWPFLDEGVTTYATSEVAEALYGEGEITSLVPLETAALDRFRAARVASHADVAAAAGDFATGSDYGALVYARTGTILRTIDRVWDGAAARAVSKYARRERFRHPGPDALERAIEEEGGEAARRFFHSAAFERGWVDFEPLPVANVARDEGGFVSEVVVRRAGTLVLPVEVALTKRDGSRELVTWDGEGDTHTFRVEGGSPVTAVRVDPALRVLIDDDKLDDGWVASPDDAAPRTRALAASLSFAALSAVLP